MNLFLAAGQGFKIEPVQHYFEMPAIFLKNSALFMFNRTAALMLLSAVIVALMMWAAFGNAKVVPSKFQAIMELVVQFIREQVVLQTIGPEGLKFLPFLTAIFLFIFVNNIYEITPFIQFPTTSRMAIPALGAVMVYTIFVILGFKAQGPAYLKNVAIPGGVPIYLLPLVIPIEIASTFILRPLTLAIRLFANLVAGHILLTILFIAANAFFIDVSGGLGALSFNLRGSPVGLVALVMAAGIVAFELLVSVLQAYIFTILAAVYIGGALHPEH